MDWTVEWNVEWLKHNTVVRIAHPLLKQAIGHCLGPKWHSIRSHHQLHSTVQSIPHSAFYTLPLQRAIHIRIKESQETLACALK